MKKFKNFLLTIFVFLILLHSSNVYSKSYSDTTNHWGREYIKTISDAGFINGYDSNEFRPDNNISKAEFFAVINSMANLKKTYPVTFEDVLQSDWFYGDVSKAIKAGYLTPTTGYLRPNDNISRQDVMYILGYMYKLKPDVSMIAKFRDSAEIKDQNKGYVGALIKNGVVDGSRDLLLRPRDGISRAEVCKLLYTLMDEFGLPSERVVVDSKIKFGDKNLYN